MDKYSSQLSYWIASLLAATGAMTLQDWAVLVGILVAVFTAGVNWYYKRKLVNSSLLSVMTKSARKQPIKR